MVQCAKLGALIRKISGNIEAVLTHYMFNVCIVCGAFYHLAMIAAHNCHGETGESGYFCSKAWENCKRIDDNGLGIYSVNGTMQCPIRVCNWFDFYDPKACSPKLMDYSNRPFYSYLLEASNYWLRWIYTVLIAARMCSSGLMSTEKSFFRDYYCLLDLIIMASAWVNVYFPHGNMMFLVVLRFNITISKSTHPLGAPLRIIVNSIINGVGELTCLYALITFFMGFFGLLAMSLVGSKGDFHNRCAVPLRGPGNTFTYEPIMPPRTCRMDHLYNPDTTKDCYGDVWASVVSPNFVPASKLPGAVDPTGLGCRGTCANVPWYDNKKLGSQLNLTVSGQNYRFGSIIEGSEVYCIGPDLFPVERKTIPPTTQEGLPLKEYKATNLSNWPAILDIRSWDNIGAASISLYTVYYRSAWAEVFDVTRASTASAVFVVWVFVVMMITYYVLNTSVGIICRNYSLSVEQEAAAVEARRKALEKPSLDDDDDDESAKGGESEDEEEQDLSGTEDDNNIRKKLQKTAQVYIDEKNLCGKGCGRLPILIGTGVCAVLEWLGEFMAKRASILGYACVKVKSLGNRSLWVFCRDCSVVCIRASCQRCVSVAIWFAIPDSPVSDFKAGTEKFAPLEWIGLGSAFGCLVTLLMQLDAVNNFKCGCTDDQMQSARNVSALQGCTTAGECLDSAGALTSDYTCVTGVCMQTAKGIGYACFNPYWNPKLEALRLATGNPPAQPSASSWADDRKTMCAFGSSLHYVLYAWALIFLLETFVNWLGHQGWTNYLTYKLRGCENREQAGVLTGLPVISTFHRHGVHVKNLVDALANLATAIGIILTELSLGPVQVLNARISFGSANAASVQGPYFDTAAAPWTVKFLRIAILGRFVVRIGLLERNPWCAAVIRGLRGVYRLFLGQCVILFSIFLFAIAGKEFFDYGYSSLSGPYMGYADFHDISNSLVPLLNIMASGSFYEYAKQATSVFGITGFIYVSFYYFITNFQVLNIFVAIIVQNYVLKDDEKIEAQIAILRSNFEGRKQVKSAGDRDDVVGGAYEETWGDFRAHYNELLKGAQLSLRSLMQFQRNVAKEDGPFNKEVEDYLAGIDTTKDIMSKVETEEENETTKQEKRQQDVDNRLSIRKSMFNIDIASEKNADIKPTWWERFMKFLAKLLKNQWWNFFTAAVVIFSTAMAVITTLPSNTEFTISIAIFVFFLLEMAIKMLRHGILGRWRFADSPLGGDGGLLFYLKGIRAGKEMKMTYPGYFVRRWCILEFLIIIVQVLDIYMSLLPKESQFTDPGLFKGLRACRIIRLLSNLQNMPVPEELSWKPWTPHPRINLKVPSIKFSDSNPIKTIMLALGASLPSILILMTFAFGMLVTFSLIGMEQFGGMLTACSNDDDLYDVATLCNNTDSDCFPGYQGQCVRGLCLLNQEHCFSNKLVAPQIYRQTNWRSATAELDFSFPQPRIWVSTRLNFDTAPMALFSTFSSVSRSGVAFLMRALGSVTGRTTAPLSGLSPNFYAYVIILNLLVGVFICQVVIGIILTNLQLKSGYAFHTKEQLVWPATKNMFDRYMPDPKNIKVDSDTGDTATTSSDNKKDADTKKHPWFIVSSFMQKKMQQVEQSWKFRLLVTVTILLNIAILLSYGYDSPGPTQLRDYYIGFACFAVYVLEAVVKIIADPKRYFSNTSDNIDFTLTLWNAMELFVNPHVLGIDVSLASLRMFRLFNLLMKIDAMIQLVKMITGGLFEALASGILLGFVMFVFGCVGTRFFSFVKDGKVMSPIQVGFIDLPESLITLFKLSSSTDTFLLDVIDDGDTTAPFCTAPTWIPYGSSSFPNPNPFGRWKNMDMAYPDITTDCGNTQTSYFFFLSYIIICNYLLLPTYIAVVLNNVFEESVKAYSLVKEEELKLFVEAWVLTFGRKSAITLSPKQEEEDVDDRKKSKARHDFSQLDNLLQTLDMKGCRLFVEQNSSGYKLATAKLRDERGKLESGDIKAIVIECKPLAVVLLSVIEKVRPVTIVDRLRRELAVKILEEEAKRPPALKKKAREGKLHASMNLPTDSREKMHKSTTISDADLVFSYNIYVVLDQLSKRGEKGKSPIAPECHEALKKLVEEDDEDLFVYFEEYVENSGPDYPREEQIKTLDAFQKKVMGVYARRNPGSKDKGDGKGAEGEKKPEGGGKVMTMTTTTSRRMGCPRTTMIGMRRRTLRGTRRRICMARLWTTAR